MELDQLIAAEQRNDETVRRAREEAAAIVAEARDRAVRREAELTLGIERLIREGESAIAAERERRGSAMLARAESDVRRFDGITDAQIAGMVPSLIDGLLAHEAAT